jgi:hypothetical protein
MMHVNCEEGRGRIQHDQQQLTSHNLVDADTHTHTHTSPEIWTGQESIYNTPRHEINTKYAERKTKTIHTYIYKIKKMLHRK